MKYKKNVTQLVGEMHFLSANDDRYMAMRIWMNGIWVRLWSIYLGVCCGDGGKLLLPWFSDDTIAGIARLFAEFTRLMPCDIRSLKLCRCWSNLCGRGSSISSKSSISPLASWSVTLNSTALCCSAAVASTGPQIVDVWHFVVHFRWQHIEHSRHWTPSFSQIFRPQKSHWVVRWKCLRSKSCWRDTFASALSATSKRSMLEESLSQGGAGRKENSDSTCTNSVRIEETAWTD